MARIFLCYAPEDEVPVGEIYSRLHQEGFQPWMGKRNLSPGQNRREGIRDALQISDFMLIFFSSDSVARKGYLQEDFQYALTCLETIPESKISIIPVKIDPCDPPLSVQHLSLQHRTWACLFEAGGFEKLVAAIRARMAMRPNPELERRARRQVHRLLWLSLSLLVVIELALLMLTWHYGWDTMEPWTYFFGVFLLVCTYGYFVFTTHEFSPRIFYEQLITTRLAKLTLIAKESQRLDSRKVVPSFTNSIGMEFVLIPAGTFLMGTPTEQVDAIAGGDQADRDWIENETPQHQVEISQPFYLGRYQVTQVQWESMMGNNPSTFESYSQCPVENVFWDDVQVFMQKLSEQEGRQYRLPTEAEWEYACRAGSSTVYYFGNDVAQLSEYAWYEANSDGQTHPVGQKLPNAWGLYDMHGNVWEWVLDWYDEYYYRTSLHTDPQGPEPGSFRVIRGGSWGSAAQNARSANRGWYRPGCRLGRFGFRCAMSVPSK
jgi:formylglycine-generating enzyme required for sulfatase activity